MLHLPIRVRTLRPFATRHGPAPACAQAIGPAGAQRHALGKHRFPDAAAPGWAFEGSPTATIVTDDRLHILAANAAYERLTGLRRSAWLGSTPPVEGMPGDAAHAASSGAGSRAFAPREVMLQGANGRRQRVWMAWARLATPRGGKPLHLATLCEMGHADDEFELWRHRARHDALTGLPNREYLEAEIERGLARAARRGKQLAVLFLDLDGFKPVNDELGHAAGDRLLASVGRRLRQALRAGDFVARYGGDEFVAVIEEARHAADAAATAEAMLAALRRETAVPGDPAASIQASIGIALYPEHGRDAHGLLHAADQAMYQAKRAGGHSYAVAPCPAAPRPRLPEAA